MKLKRSTKHAIKKAQHAVKKARSATKKAAKKISKDSKRKKGGDNGSDDSDSSDTDTDTTSNTINDTPIDDLAVAQQIQSSEKTVANIITTLVMCGDDYIPGALVLAKSLRKWVINGGSDDVTNDNTSVTSDNNIQLWCMCTNDVSAAALDILKQYYDNVILVPYLQKDVIEMRTKKQQDIYGGWISKSFTKWNIFNPELFPTSKVLFIDADMIALSDISDIFDFNCDLAATFSSPWTKPFAKVGENPYYHQRSLNHGEIVSLDDIKNGLHNSIAPIASMVLVVPDSKIYNWVYNRSGSSVTTSDTNSASLYGYPKCVSGFDEQMLAEIALEFKLTCMNIHQSYNWLAGKTAWLEGAEPKTCHYYNIKPWQQEPAYDDEKIWHEYAREIAATDLLSAQWFNY